MEAAWIATVGAALSLLAALWSWEAREAALRTEHLLEMTTAKPQKSPQTAQEISKPLPQPITSQPLDKAEYNPNQPNRFRRQGIAEQRRAAEFATLQPITDAEKRVAANTRAMEGK